MFAAIALKLPVFCTAGILPPGMYKYGLPCCLPIINCSFAAMQ